MVARARDHRRAAGSRSSAGCSCCRVALGFWLTFAAGIGVLAARRPRDDRALARRPDHRLLLLVGARHLARGPRLPLLHDHRPEDDPGDDARADRLRGLGRAPRDAPDRAGEDRVLGEGRAARRARSSPARAGRCWSAPRARAARAAAQLALAGAALVALYAAARRRGHPARPVRSPRRSRTPAAAAIAIGTSQGVSTSSTAKTARRMAGDLVADLGSRRRRSRGATRRRSRGPRPARLPELRRQVWAPPTADRRPAYRLDRLRVHFSLGHGQGAAVAVAKLDGTQQLTTYLGCRRGRPPRRSRRLPPDDRPAARPGRWLVARIHGPHAGPALAGPSAARARRRAAGARRRAPDRRRAAGRARLPPGRLPLRRHRRPAGDDGRRALLARLRQRRLARPLRRQLATARATSARYSKRGGLPRSVLFRNVPRALRRTSRATRAPATRAARAASPPT